MRAYYIPDLEEDILMLRRHEKDYLLRGDKSYVEQARSTVRIILDNISGSEISAEEKKALGDQMLDCEQDFLHLPAPARSWPAVSLRTRSRLPHLIGSPG